MKLIDRLKDAVLLIIIFILFLYKGVFINLYSNITNMTQNQNNKYESEINILKLNIEELSNNLEELSDSFSKKEYNYTLSKLSYRKTYNTKEFYIYGGKDKKYKENYAIANEFGLLGIITKVKDNYSECKLITSIDNLSVVINDAFGTLKNYDNDLFIVDTISNYDNINLNDPVYTSPLGTIKEKILVGYVFKIEDNEIDKKLYVKSKVNFNNINYIHVIGG